MRFLSNAVNIDERETPDGLPLAVIGDAGNLVAETIGRHGVSADSGGPFGGADRCQTHSLLRCEDERLLQDRLHKASPVPVKMRV